MLMSDIYRAAGRLSGVFLLALMLPVVTHSTPVPGESTDTAASQFEVVLRLSQGDMEHRLRELAETWIGPEKPLPVVKRTPLKRFGEVVSTVPYQIKPKGLQVASNASRPSLTVSLPIDINSSHRIDGMAGAVIESRGCGAGEFILKARYAMDVVSGRLVLNEQRTWVDDGGHECVIGVRGPAKWVTDGIKLIKPDLRTEVDVTAKMRSGVLAQARPALDHARTQLVAWLADADRVRQLAAAPVSFARAVMLGLESTIFVPSDIGIEGDDLVLRGDVGGYPRIHFGVDWPEATPVSGDIADADGFKLPLKALFPRDRALLPEPDTTKVSGWSGGSAFRLKAIPGRNDLVALQHNHDERVENLIWLSGDTGFPENDPMAFDKPMRDVFRELVCWLNRKEMWRGVTGIDALRKRVVDVRATLARFERETRLPLDGRGELFFRDMRVDLRRVWVTDQAIWADLVLHGRARLEMRYEI